MASFGAVSSRLTARLNPRARAGLDLLAHPGRIRDNLRLRVKNRPSPARHIFVLGPPRSGSTLTQVLLGAHSKLAACDSETGVFTWQDLFMPGRAIAGLDDAVLGPLLAHAHSQVAFFDAVADEVCRAKGATRFVEKTPQHVRQLGRLLSWYPHARFVFTYRDGRDCFCSAQSHAWMAQKDDVRAFARYWRNLVRPRLSVDSDRIFDLSYEELTAEPETKLGELMAFLGESLEAQQLDHERRARDARSQQQAFKRLGRPIDGSSRGRYLQDMSPDALAEFEALAGTELVALGYPLHSQGNQDSQAVPGSR